MFPCLFIQKRQVHKTPVQGNDYNGTQTQTCANAVALVFFMLAVDLTYWGQAIYYKGVQPSGRYIGSHYR